ncbi:MAG: hypothetical protein DHS20C17_23330 [Cyclobacteriaceae bacterium]|nr:MAG: hypothetical protein DHS20C17_23330 [Cyclobacteriaceae bacterium]
MKKSLIIVGALVTIILIAIFAIPILFKAQIQKIVDDAIRASVRAEVSYEDFNLSLIRNFPNLSLSVDELSIAGVEEFAGDTLVYAENFTVSVNFVQAILSDRLTIKKINLERPKIFVKVLESGLANYDIAVESETSEAAESSDYDLGIQGWEVENGTMIYDDRQTKVFLKLQGITHSGSGDFTSDLFDLTTTSVGEVVSLQYEGFEYLENKQIDADVTLEMDLPQSKYTFKDNRIAINQFTIGIDGWLSMPENSEDIIMDLSFQTLQNEFQDLLSCVPGMYMEGFENIESSGTVDLAGVVNGTYNEDKIPSFQVTMEVVDGRFKYPDLPTSVENINLDMVVANSDGITDNTSIDISELHLDFGKNPLDGTISINGLATPEINADLNTKLDLGELTSMFPMEGTTLKGIYTLSLKAVGKYDSAAQTFPVVDASMSLDNGYVKSSEFPESLEQFHFISMVTNPTGNLPDTRIEVPKFNFVMDGEPVSGKLVLVNPNDFSWDVAIDGGVNLEKLTHIFSLEDMTLKGIIRGNLASKGKMSSLEAEKYADIPTSGTIEIENFSYSSKELSHAFEISSGKTSFTPQQITISDVRAQTGATDLAINGAVTNYINYMFKEQEPIAGNLKIESQNVNLNEWMEESATSEQSDDLSVIEIPDNVNFTLDATAGTVLYDNMTLSDLKGQVLVQNGIAQLNDVTFNSLGGGFLISGSYDPRNKVVPEFDMKVQMQKIAFKEAFETFNTVKILAPVAQFLSGDFSSSFKFNGALKPDMTPALATLNGSGLINIVTATLSGTDSKLIQGFTAITKFNDTPKAFNLNDVIMAVKIKDGQMDVAPFEAAFGDYTTRVSGSTGIDGSMNFLLNMEVPAGVVGTSVNQAIAKLTKSDQPVDDKINVNLKLSGTYSNPQFALGGVQDEGSTTNAVQSAVNQKTQEAKDSAKQVVDQKTEKLTESTKKKLDSLISDQVSDSASADAIKEVTKDLLDKDNVEGVLDLFKKKTSKKDTTKTK